MCHNNIRGINPSCGVGMHERLTLIISTEITVGKD